MDDIVTDELRNKTRERVIAYEVQIRQLQQEAQPSQIMDRDAVPGELGGYTDEQIDRIIRIERLLEGGIPGETDEERLARALQRFILTGNS
jgi:hypothetical protein